MNQLKIIAVLALFSIVILTSCRHSSHHSAEGWDYQDMKCYENGALTVEQRTAKYPFSKAEEIRIISFDDSYNPLKSDSLRTVWIQESISLNSEQINELTNILYNFNYSKSTKTQMGSSSFCYLPRHAVLFYDSKGEMMEFMEYCFECVGKRSSDEKVEMGEFCQGKYELLEVFFKKCGITKFGGIKENNPELR